MRNLHQARFEELEVENQSLKHVRKTEAEADDLDLQLKDSDFADAADGRSHSSKVLS